MAGAVSKFDGRQVTTACRVVVVFEVGGDGGVRVMTFPPRSDDYLEDVRIGWAFVSCEADMGSM